MAKQKFYRSINGTKTELTALTATQIENLTNQCIKLMQQVDPEECGYLLNEVHLDPFPASTAPIHVKRLGVWIDTLEARAVEHHVHVSPETLQWSNMEETRFTTINKNKLPALSLA